MVKTTSNMLPLGHKAAAFHLPDVVSEQIIYLTEASSHKATLIMFICNHCPYVIHIRDELFRLAKHYQTQGVNVIAINANDVRTYPDDAPDKMRELALKYELNFPYCYDETQAVAKAYQAACTPDFFLFDGDLACVYRGQFDDSRPGGSLPVTGASLRNAIDALLSNQPIDKNQFPSVGCNIKWKT